MEKHSWKENIVIYGLIGVFCCIGIIQSIRVWKQSKTKNNEYVVSESIVLQENKDFIKWVDFNVSYEALCTAYQYDIDTYQSEIHINWIELLAYTAAREGGKFTSKSIQIINKTASELIEKTVTMDEITEKLKYYPYYLEAYTAVLAEYVGPYEIESLDAEGNTVWTEKYGLKCFSPIAYGFPYSDYDDFGSSRSYGYKREHLGHDMTGQVGTPIIAIESGKVEALGWNQYGGWRVGIRSFDGKRYYYYAHMRQNRPYAEGLKEGDEVVAGDVIGYIGRTGYSRTENVNNIKVNHLHWGLQLIFDESQKDGNGEIWVDCYALSRFLYKNRSVTVRNDETKEWKRKFLIR